MLSRFQHLQTLYIRGDIPACTISALAKFCPALRLIVSEPQPGPHSRQVVPVNQLDEQSPVVHDPEDLGWLEF